MDLLIHASFFSHSRRIKDKPFVWSTRKKSNHTIIYLQNTSHYIIIECKIYYIFLKKYTKLKTLSNNKYIDSLIYKI